MWQIVCCELKTQADIWGVCVHFVYSYLIGFIQMQFSASPSSFLCVMTHSQTLVWCSYFPLIHKSVFFITRVVAELTILSFLPVSLWSSSIYIPPCESSSEFFPACGWLPSPSFQGLHRLFAVFLLWSPDSLGIWGELSNCDYVAVLLETKPTSVWLCSISLLPMPSQVTVGHHKVTVNFLKVNMWSKIIFNQVDLKKLSKKD